MTPGNADMINAISETTDFWGDAVPDQQANWIRYLRSSGVSDFYALTPAAQQHLSAQFPAWVRRQATIGKLILTVFVVLAVTMIAVAAAVLV